MVGQMITLKLENNFLNEVDKYVVEEGFSNRTEFIRNALKERIDKIKIKKALFELEKLQGSSKNKISQKAYEEAREKAFEMLK